MGNPEEFVDYNNMKKNQKNLVSVNQRGGGSMRQNNQHIPNGHHGALSINANTYIGGLNEVRSPQVLGSTNNEFQVPDIGVFPSSVTNSTATGQALVVGQPKRKVNINNIKFNMQ